MFKFIKMHNDVEIPEYQTTKSSGLDLKAYIKNDNNRLVIPAQQSIVVPTGLKLEIDPCFITLNTFIPFPVEAQIRSRSGLAAKHEIFVLNSPGTIDEDYAGELKVILFNLSQELFIVHDGDRIAQIVFTPIIRNMNYVKDSVRGEGGFGSTGK